MSLASDLRVALVFGLIGCLWLVLGILDFRADDPAGAWRFQFVIGAFTCLLVADGLQRRWRGDPRVRERGPDRRSLGALIVALLGLAAVGLWSYAQGHAPDVWAVVVGLAVACAVLLAWALRGLDA